MRLTKKASLKALFRQIPSFAKTGNHSLFFLNITQSLGVVNDNLFKFVMAFLLIDALGHAQASKILSATGAIYVIPFLLFSSSAGILADRFSKQKLLVLMKSAEIVVMILALFAFGFKSVWGCYTLLFILSSHSAMFGPSKYGIIPELVPSGFVSKANGLITSFTYLSIIIGTFLASFLTELTDRHFTIIALFCLLISGGGLLSALWVKQTPAQGSDKKINPFFVREIYQTLKTCQKTDHLLPAIFGAAYFLLIGAFTQLNIIPFALESLHLSEVAGGYLFLATALGIALGSFLAGKASRKRTELGISCLAGFGISFFFLLIGIFSGSLYKVIGCLIAIGVLGGAFIVPFDTFIQLSSSNDKRGQTIAASNFLSFGGVLIASILLYLFSQFLGFSSAVSFFTMGILTLFMSIFLTVRLSNFAIPYFAKHILTPLFRCRPPENFSLEQTQHSFLILEHFSWKNALLIASFFPNLHYFISTHSPKWHWCFRFFFNIHPIDPNTPLSETLQSIRSATEKGKTPCLLLDNHLPADTLQPSKGVFNLFKKNLIPLVKIEVIHDHKKGECQMTLTPRNPSSQEE